MIQFQPVTVQLQKIRRGVEKIVPEEELFEKLRESRRNKRPLRVKYGIDPTGVDLHLGHTVPLRKMRQFQELGHQPVIIIGNYTALVGDPSGQDETRPRMSVEQVEKNAADYLEQVGKVLDLGQAEVVRNGDWFAPMSFAEVLELCSKVTMAQLLTREDFAKRYREEKAIYLHECLYPVMQAWDSVMVRADVELGGTEQLYSFMLARDLQRDQRQPGQVGIMSPILVGTDGVRRMGKSLGNYIGINEPPFEMIKKIMGLPDQKEQEDGTTLQVMRQWFELLTDVPKHTMHQLLAGHPKETKLELAKAIIGDYHGSDAANDAADRWEKEIAEKELPADIPVVDISSSELTDGTLPAAQLLKKTGLVPSTSEARRSIAQGGAYLGEDKTRIESHDQTIVVEDGLILRVGKKRICRVELTE